MADGEESQAASLFNQLNLVCIMLTIYHSLDLVHNMGELCSKQHSQTHDKDENDSTSTKWKGFDLCLSLNSIFGFAVFIWA